MTDYLSWRTILLKVRRAVLSLHGGIQGVSPNYFYSSFNSWHVAPKREKGFEIAFQGVFWVLFCFVFALQDILSYHKRSYQRLPPGLYLGYLKLCSSVDQIKVLVTQKLPNILCHVKVRENNNISK